MTKSFAGASKQGSGILVGRCIACSTVQIARAGQTLLPGTLGPYPYILHIWAGWGGSRIIGVGAFGIAWHPFYIDSAERRQHR